MAWRKPSSIAVRTVLPCIQLLANALEDQHVGVDRDADRQHEAGESRQREHGVDQASAASVKSM